MTDYLVVSKNGHVFLKMTADRADDVPTDISGDVWAVEYAKDLVRNYRGTVRFIASHVGTYNSRVVRDDGKVEPPSSASLDDGARAKNDERAQIAGYQEGHVTGTTTWRVLDERSGEVAGTVYVIDNALVAYGGGFAPTGYEEGKDFGAFCAENRGFVFEQIGQE